MKPRTRLERSLKTTVPLPFASMSQVTQEWLEDIRKRGLQSVCGRTWPETEELPGDGEPSTGEQRND